MNISSRPHSASSLAGGVDSALVPKHVASEQGVIPLFLKEEEGRTTQLFLGMEDPSNLAVLDDLSFRTGMEVHPVMVGPSELGEAMDRYYLGPSAAHSADSDRDVAGNLSGALVGDAMGERSLRRVTDEEVPPEESVLAPACRDNEIELSDSSAELPDGLLEDVAHALDESERTRIVAKAIAQLLIEKGIFTLEEVQAQIAREYIMRLEYGFALADCEIPRFAVEAVEGIGKLFTLATLVLNVLSTKERVEIVFHGLNPEDPERKIQAFREIANSSPTGFSLHYTADTAGSVPGSSSYYQWLTVSND